MSISKVEDRTPVSPARSTDEELAQEQEAARERARAVQRRWMAIHSVLTTIPGSSPLFDKEAIHWMPNIPTRW